MPITQFAFTINGYTGTNYVVETAANLLTANWTPVMTNAAPIHPVQRLCVEPTILSGENFTVIC